MPDSLLITGARICNEGQIFEGDVFCRAGRIEKIAAAIDCAAQVHIDAAGQLLIPGMIDDQVHFREPGLTHKGDIGSESAAAVAGGITSFMEMPNTDPTTTTLERLAEKYAIARRTAQANYAFYLGASNDNIEQIKRLGANDAAGVKVFMGSSTGNMLVDNPETLAAVFAHAPSIVTTHCEDSPLIARNAEAARLRYGGDVPITAHPEIRSEEACWLSSSLAVELARKHGTALHVLHLTTERELQLFEPGPVEDKQITVEVCCHHLFFDESAYAERGNFIKCNPAIKQASDRKALLQAVAEGRIDVIATDHAPHTLAEKTGPYERAAAGLPLVQDALPALFELVRRGELDIPTVVDRTSHNVARRFQVAERGFLREGYWADLTLLNLDRPPPVSRDQVRSRCGWSPFEGQRLGARVAATVINGQLRYQDGKLIGPSSARSLIFDR